MHYSNLAHLSLGTLNIAFAFPSSMSNPKPDIDPEILSQNPSIPQPIVRIDLDTIADGEAASADNPISQELIVELELSGVLPPSSGLQKPVSLPSSSSSSLSSMPLFYYGSAPLDQSIDVVRAAITEGPRGVKCKLYNYLIGDEGLGYDANVLTSDNVLNFERGPFKKVSAIDCVAERAAVEEEKKGQ